MYGFKVFMTVFVVYCGTALYLYQKYPQIVDALGVIAGAVIVVILLLLPGIVEAKNREIRERKP